jgi:hypothetical protein
VQESFFSFLAHISLFTRANRSMKDPKYDGRLDDDPGECERSTRGRRTKHRHWGRGVLSL